MKRCILLFIALLLATSCTPKPEQEEMISYQEEIEIQALSASLDRKNIRIALDAGHGGKDCGASVSHLSEKNLCLVTTLLTKRYLDKLGYQVILTRHNDTYLPLKKRVEIANRSKASLFVSIHFNTARSTDAKGIEIYYYAPQEKGENIRARRFAEIVLGRVIGLTHTLSRGVKKGNLCVIRETKMPAILIEGGFMTNKQEFSHLINRSYLSKIAKGIAEGVDSYLVERAKA